MGRCSGKDAAAMGALELLSSIDARVVGIGTGSTVARFVDEASSWLRGRVLLSSSRAASLLLSREGLSAVDHVSYRGLVDVYVDGADEVDPEGRLIKGRGGALLGEKILAYWSRLNIIIVDESKLVNVLGERKPVPLEVVPQALSPVLEALSRMGFSATPREGSGKDGPVVSDWGGVIVDVRTGPMRRPEDVDLAIRSIPGVVETGIFAGLTDIVVVGGGDCTWRVMRFKRSRGLVMAGGGRAP